MKTSLVLLLLFLAGGAFVLSGRYGQGTDKSESGTKKTPTKLKIVGERENFRCIKHLLGETKVPLAPRRIVSLNTAVTDSLVALDIKPVLVERNWNYLGPAPYLAERLPDVPTVGQGGSINLEIVMAAKPDLVFLGNIQDGRLYSQLSKIAPTVYITSAEGSADRVILEVGAVLGMREQAEKRWQQYNQCLAEARRALQKTIAQEPVVFLRFRMNTCVIYSREPTMVGPLLFDRLKLTPDPMVPTTMARGGWDVLSVERLSMLRAEYIFFTVDADSEHYYQTVADTPLWHDIPAVKHGHAHRVELKTWLSNGILAYEAMLDDVLAAATKRPSFSPEPTATVGED
jgi:iron complex transport system substrate-binding protein